MDITYIGHSSFKFKSPNATVVTDPFNNEIGIDMPKISADVVTVSHNHSDHNNIKAISGTARREKPFIIEAPGEYEIGGVSVFGVASYHDDKEGADRGKNVIYSILMETISVVHLGDLGHDLTPARVTGLDGVDVLICPVGGHFTINPKLIADIVAKLEPSIFIPMHYKTEAHNPSIFNDLITLDEFAKLFGTTPKVLDKLSLSRTSIPEEMEVIALQQVTS